mgnify:CR=1 FL=1
MATKSANLYARIEPDVKEQAEGILAALGIPASNAINMFYKQIILQRGLPFELKSPENASGQLDRLEACILFYIFRMMIHKWLRLFVLCTVEEMWIRN